MSAAGCDTPVHFKRLWQRFMSYEYLELVRNVIIYSTHGTVLYDYKCTCINTTLYTIMCIVVHA